jgi:hypothetical protein
MLDSKSDLEFCCRVLDYVRDQHDFSAVYAWELGPGVVSIHDSMDEIDTYFDPERWEAIEPELWGDTLFPGHMKMINIGVLQGVGCHPQPKTIGLAAAFARGNLTSKNDSVTWHREPIAFKP